MNKLTYRNQKGIDFEIEFQSADVPSDADYFGYIIKVIANDDPRVVHRYKAIVKRELCQSEQSARMWLNTTAFDFLKSILETYDNGRTLLLIPESQKWFVL